MDIDSGYLQPEDYLPTETFPTKVSLDLACLLDSAAYYNSCPLVYLYVITKPSHLVAYSNPAFMIKCI